MSLDPKNKICVNCSHFEGDHESETAACSQKRRLTQCAWGSPPIVWKGHTCGLFQKAEDRTLNLNHGLAKHRAFKLDQNLKESPLKRSRSAHLAGGVK